MLQHESIIDIILITDIDIQSFQLRIIAVIDPTGGKQRFFNFMELEEKLLCEDSGPVPLNVSCRDFFPQ